MENKKSQNQIEKCQEDQIDTPNMPIHDHSLAWLRTVYTSRSPEFAPSHPPVLVGFMLLDL
jgi:hypothetical protein